MENPMTWGPVENIIHKAFIEWEQTATRPGPSLEMTIANALRAEGLIKEDDGNLSQDSNAVQA
jgi:hypothetical protein